MPPILVQQLPEQLVLVQPIVQPKSKLQLLVAPPQPSHSPRLASAHH